MRRRPWWRFLQFFAQVLCLVVFRVRAFGQRNVPLDGAVVLACNHQSFLDPVLVGVALRRELTYMARAELFGTRGLRWLIESLNAFPVRRESADVRAIKEALRRLRRGQALVAFPEGTRTPDGAIQCLEPGVFLIARRAGAAVVPTLILGAFECWPRHRRFPRPGAIVVAYGAPIPATRMRGLADEACAALVRSRLDEMAERYRHLPDLHARRRPGGDQ